MGTIRRAARAGERYNMRQRRRIIRGWVRGDAFACAAFDDGELTKLSAQWLVHEEVEWMEA